VHCSGVTLQGPQGPPGVKGEKGDVGAAGETGPAVSTCLNAQTQTFYNSRPTVAVGL